jgi:hypothetical protein
MVTIWHQQRFAQVFMKKLWFEEESYRGPNAKKRRMQDISKAADQEEDGKLAKWLELAAQFLESETHRSPEGEEEE